MIYYIHGSEDSIDKDIFYVFEKIPDIKECREFCSADINENRNIITINNGVVTDCFIGTIDECNNSLLDTYNLHKQDHPLLINKRIDRDILLKEIRMVRGVLSILSRTQYRDEIKYALRTSWSARLECLNKIDFTKIDFEKLDKRQSKEDYLKIIAFQFGQTLGLIDGYELYTKSSIANTYSDLKNFLYRTPGDVSILNDYKDIIYEHLIKIPAIDLENNCTDFSGRIMDLKHEKQINKKEHEYDLY